jgi:cytochrome bd ubiquinol oxidase subunit II
VLQGLLLDLLAVHLWQEYWEFNFVVANFLLAILFGAAAGNLARGVPLDAHGDFSMAFFTDFGVRGNVGCSTGTRYQLPSSRR